MDEEGKGMVKHIFIAKFKDDVPPQKINGFIEDFANLAKFIPQIKAFHWGKDVGELNMHQGFTHVFELTFESLKDLAEYMAHPTHMEFAKDSGHILGVPLGYTEEEMIKLHLFHLQLLAPDVNIAERVVEVESLAAIKYSSKAETLSL